MTLEELKENVRQLISRAKTNDAINIIIKWAKEQHQEELKKEATILEGHLTALNQEKRIGVLTNSEATREQNKINYGLLNLLDTITNKDQVHNTTLDDSPSPSKKLKILMLTANPAETTKLNLDREHSIITQKLQQKQEFFNIILKKAVSGTEFKEFTQQEKPSILHFSGHGATGKYAGIKVHNEDKNEVELLTVNGLNTLFKFFKRRLNLIVVLLNACHTQEQAATISKYVDYVIGTNVAIGDKAASAFSSGFYFQLAEDTSMNIENAFDSGRTEAVMKGAAEDNFVIYHNGALLEVT